MEYREITTVTETNRLHEAPEGVPLYIDGHEISKVWLAGSSTVRLYENGERLIDVNYRDGEWSGGSLNTEDLNNILGEFHITDWREAQSHLSNVHVQVPTGKGYITAGNLEFFEIQEGHWSAYNEDFGWLKSGSYSDQQMAQLILTDNDITWSEGSANTEVVLGEWSGVGRLFSEVSEGHWVQTVGNQSWHYDDETMEESIAGWSDLQGSWGTPVSIEDGSVGTDDYGNGYSIDWGDYDIITTKVVTQSDTVSVDSHDEITISDSIAILRDIVDLDSIEHNSDAFHAADINNDGVINISDAIASLRHIVDLEPINSYKVIDDKGNHVSVELVDNTAAMQYNWHIVTVGNADLSGYGEDVVISTMDFI